jgi:hypothetical protein
MFTLIYAGRNVSSRQPKGQASCLMAHAQRGEEYPPTSAEKPISLCLGAVETRCHFLGASSRRYSSDLQTSHISQKGAI